VAEGYVKTSRQKKTRESLIYGSVCASSVKGCRTEIFFEVGFEGVRQSVCINNSGAIF
jgi:hypothetical protein